MKVFLRKTFYKCVWIVLVGSACTTKTSEQNVDFSEDTLSENFLSGQALAQQHCSSCHAYVAPEALPRSIWKEKVLPEMGRRMGIYVKGSPPDSLFEAGRAGELVRQANVYPQDARLSNEAWEQITAYYLAHAPEKVESNVERPMIKLKLPHFTYRPSGFSQQPPLTNMVKILANGSGLVFSDGKRDGSTLNFLDAELKKRYDIRLPSIPVNFRTKNDTILLTTIGRKMLPSDQPDGAVQALFSKENKGVPNSARLLLKGLQRPVHTAYADLNKDGREDILVCEFGNLTGKLAWYENTGNDYQQHILKASPGASRVHVRDVNDDGLSDILVLMAQGGEGIDLLTNQGDGNFVTERLLTFPPHYGSTYFELVDFNADGHEDILYTCGDNADMSPILKDFHGVYIFLNDGKYNFKQAYFFPLHGAYKAIARDFDLDGDLDIASISFFPDYQQRAEESFVYLQNEGKLSFAAHSFPQATAGRWIVMDDGDIDQDGDIDLALGSFVGYEPDGDSTGLYEKWLEGSPSVILLENTVN